MTIGEIIFFSKVQKKSYRMHETHTWQGITFCGEQWLLVYCGIRSGEFCCLPGNCSSLHGEGIPGFCSSSAS